MSQPEFPKQFLTVFNNTPLVTQTIRRISPYFKRDERILIVPEQLRKITRAHVGKTRIIVEPERRNTAAAICLAAFHLRKRYGDGIMHVMPADHLITPGTDFLRALKVGQRLARTGCLVTYGITPERPETGYGYVRTGRKISTGNAASVYQGLSFTEKPTRARARRYLKSGKYFWNSGIFTFGVQTILCEMKRRIPRVYQGVQEYSTTGKSKHFKRIPDISIDYGVMEKSDKFCIVKGNFKWDDVGSWLALARYFKKDDHGNIHIGNVKGLAIYNSIMYTSDTPLRVYGADNLIIVVSPHGVLVCSKDKAPDLKNLFKDGI